MHGVIIQDRPCPRCAIRRTVLRSGVSFCFNCHMIWGVGSGPAVAPLPEPAYAFTPTETARLVIYRDAVRAGFFSDW